MQWERKIEQAERGGRFSRDTEASTGTAAAAGPAARGTRSETARTVPAEPTGRVGRFERGQDASLRPAPVASVPQPLAAVAERRTITITGQPTPARRRPTLAERHISAQPDRIALWAFLLGMLLIAVAAGTAHA